MIRMSVMYPSGVDKKFDYDYVLHDGDRRARVAAFFDEREDAVKIGRRVEAPYAFRQVADHARRSGGEFVTRRASATRSSELSSLMSGDQKSRRVASVPGSIRAVVESIERSQS